MGEGGGGFGGKAEEGLETVGDGGERGENGGGGARGTVSLTAFTLSVSGAGQSTTDSTALSERFDRLEGGAREEVETAPPLPRGCRDRGVSATKVTLSRPPDGRNVEETGLECTGEKLEQRDERRAGLTSAELNGTGASDGTEVKDRGGAVGRNS